MRLQTRLEIRVHYPTPARDCQRVLRVLPLHRAGQSIESESWTGAPDAAFTLEKRDAYGNRRLLLHHPRIEREWHFRLDITSQTTGTPVLDFTPDHARWKMPSRAVVFTPELQSIARQQRNLLPLARANYFARFCAENLRYEARTRDVPLTAPQTWARRRGNCADFAHLFLCLCRASGLVARYVAGFSRSEGQMHAWAEVWDGNYWHAFDPTRSTQDQARPIHHLAVAVGRDFHDCAPHGGQFHSEGSARIEVWCQTRELEEVN